MDEVPGEILKGFNDSWTATQLFYTNLIDSHEVYDNFVPLLFFLKKLRKAGEDKNFRVGTSRNDLIFSRSAELGLRPEQKFIAVQVKGNSFIISFRDEKKLQKEYRIKDLDDELLKGLLQTLKLQPID
jgi:hypothetical protein